MLYRLAVATGLRFSELKTLTPESFHLDSDSPLVVVQPAFTKNKEPAELPLSPEIAGEMRAWLAGKPTRVAIFQLARSGADMLKIDLAAAGIPYRDSSGLVFDFHSLRCELATLADLAGVSPRVVQKLMRHSTLEMTARYTRPRAVDMERAVTSLPSLGAAGPAGRAATGTDGETNQQPLADLLPRAGHAGREHRSPDDAPAGPGPRTLRMPRTAKKPG